MPADLFGGMGEVEFDGPPLAHALHLSLDDLAAACAKDAGGGEGGEQAMSA
ncbi:hypothetical protein ACF1A5_08230 [Streptomyces sp. NPDC014864]|uniref:hypothetical protein n=1 Tax=Streptomyces sp. NPDC014864 TaxID=3364924 RepID=UPI0036F969F1